jgi:hypothetical protein
MGSELGVPMTPFWHSCVSRTVCAGLSNSARSTAIVGPLLRVAGRLSLVSYQIV